VTGLPNGSRQTQNSIDFASEAEIQTRTGSARRTDEATAAIGITDNAGVASAVAFF
jgi:hypothetical protein